MILLDTNVISEPMRPHPDPAVVAWLDRQSADTLYLTTISLAEIRYGLSLLPEGSRRTQLRERFEDELLPHFAGRIVGFNEAASSAYASLRSTARRQGVSLSDFDALIAAVATSTRLTMATRDTTPFMAAGLMVINPWFAEV
ncbi:plasmid stability protein StbB [Microbacterium sp. CH12i]|uniref:type II toxin-antitoxin system VapC family toxin n=1 Tax=Microbacterium sp. CH12i TaxID=1479651 RepID=UPI000460B2AE|nr:type II toxin-antitoxin system VapC family toxin [Microbacterium sp. CH12i]KDA06274.1 plasmid stability protein StbB [Microbacterium sp. CH12i]